jgi:pimeloyl-ACP methyl ester carboxylesterase
MLLVCGCLACRPPVTSSGGPPKPNSSVPSVSCDGDAPVDDPVKHVPRVRGSWFNDPSGEQRLYVLEAGRRDTGRPTLLLIHGVGDIGSGDYYPVLEAISRQRHVLAVDLPGFGHSAIKNEDFGPQRLVRSIDTVRHACTSGRVDVLGHSSGGVLALLFAAEHQEDVRRLIVVDPAGILRPEVLLQGQLHQTLTGVRDSAPVTGIAIEKIGDLMIRAVDALTPSAKRMAETGMLGDSPGMLAATSLLDFNFGPAILKIQTPTLILWGKNDHVVPPRIAHLLDDRIADSQLTFVDGAGHVPMKDQPELFASLVSGYLNSKPPREPPAPPNQSTREGRCEGKKDVVFEGDFARVVVKDCEHFWLNHVRAREVEVKDSDGLIESSIVSEKLRLSNSEIALTGGELRGDVPLEVSDSELDLAGVAITGKTAAVRVHKKSKLVFSVSPLVSPKTDRVLHEALELDDGKEL